MSRLLHVLALLSLLLFAAAPASAVMLRSEKTAVPGFFGSSWESASGDECPASQYRTRSGVDCSYEPALDVRDGPNLYAYVKQNPWTAFDPDGLAEVKGYYKNKERKGVTRLEADENGAPQTREGPNGLEVRANHYTDAGDRMFSWFNGPQGEPNDSAWEPASRYGVKAPTSSAKGEWGTNVQRNLKAMGEAGNSPGVQTAGTVARASIEISAMLMTGGMTRIPFRPGAAGAEEMVTLYRGVNSTHAKYAEALQGIATPNKSWWQFWKRGASTLEHNAGRGGTLSSPYTSWSTNPEVAKNFALRTSGEGTVITTQVPRSAMIQSPNLKSVSLMQGGGVVSESEVLLRGTVKGTAERTTLW